LESAVVSNTYKLERTGERKLALEHGTDIAIRPIHDFLDQREEEDIFA
jgi:hypothetical protein